MTNRTSDIYCNGCKKYMFSLYYDDKDIGKKFYCKNKKCQEVATFDTLKKNNTGLKL